MSTSLMSLLKEYNVAWLIAGLAAVSSFWGQFRNFLRYISSFLIVQAKVDSWMTRPVIYNLRKNYGVPPSGLYNFRGYLTSVKFSTLWVLIPFRLPSNSSIYYGKCGVFYCSPDGNSDALRLFGIRGFCRFQDLISESLDFYRNLCEDESGSGYVLHKVMGSMGDHLAKYFASNKGQESKNTPETASAVAPSSIHVAFEPDPRIDTSFKYSKDMYCYDSTYNAFQGLFYTDEAASLIEDALLWKKMQSWYLDRGIPWRRGWLLHGPGGTGKSSMAKGIAQKLRIPLYQFFLSTMNDREFVSSWEEMSAPCVVLLEDFDNVFDKRVPLTEHKSLTFDCILNQISGVGSINGVLLIVTTNHLDKIDEALGRPGKNGMSSRPGRIDKIIYFGETTPKMRRDIAQYILPDFPDMHDELIVAGEGMTPAQFQFTCTKVAYENMENITKEVATPKRVLRAIK